MMGCTYMIFIEHLINYHTLPTLVLQNNLICTFMIKMMNSVADQELMYQIMNPSLFNFKPSFHAETYYTLMAVTVQL